MYKLNKGVVAPLLAEFLGAGVLVMVALILSQTTAVSYFIGTSVAVAFGLLFMLFNAVSGAHVNPALTVGLWTTRRIGTLRGIGYIAAQMLGGYGAWQLYQYFTNTHLASRSVSFSAAIWLAEVVGTAILAVGFTAAVTRAFGALESALTAGASYFVGILVAATASAGYINPAVALGSHAFSWVYVLGPVVGGIIGVNLYTYLFAPEAAVAAARPAFAGRVAGSNPKVKVTRRKK